jgi:hypothetical protein
MDPWKRHREALEELRGNELARREEEKPLFADPLDPPAPHAIAGNEDFGVELAIAADAGPELIRLRQRQRAVLEMMMAGQSMRSISKQANVSRNTIYSWMRHQLLITVLPLASRLASCKLNSWMSGMSFWENSQTTSPFGLNSRTTCVLPLETSVWPFFNRTADHGTGTATDQIGFPVASYSTTLSRSLWQTRNVPAKVIRARRNWRCVVPAGFVGKLNCVSVLPVTRLMTRSVAGLPF